MADDIPKPPPTKSQADNNEEDFLEWKPRTSWTVLPSSFSSGPLGLGDPEDTSLRKVEKEVLIPMVMRDKAWMEKCRPEVIAFEKCAKKEEFMMMFRCREKNNIMQRCVKAWFQDEDFKEECKQIYLDKRKIYRSTGEGQKLRREEMKWQ
ncbi:COX assembly mitochondrial protein homolog [Argopecten irradians]|uniref:COX assembly mitochondrial protein homolog n=1 Tax=Argopecten irradians TaxID=31199 RepID=UPI003714A831